MKLDPMLLDLFNQQFPDVENAGRPVQVIYDPFNNKIYYQTSPYIENGEIVITRVGEVNIRIKKAYNIVEEYSSTTKVGE